MAVAVVVTATVPVVVMVVPLPVVIVVVVPRVGTRPHPLAEDAEADRDDEQPGGERQPRIELLGDDEARQKERDEAERAARSRPDATSVVTAAM